MGNQDRREFIKNAGKTLLVTSGISVFGLDSLQAKPYTEDAYYSDGYYDDGYYNDGYYDDGYLTGFNHMRSDSVGLTIAPNPSNGNFKLTINTRTSQQYTIYIHDLTGKTYLRESHLLKLGTNQISFDSKKLVQGIYELSVVTSKAVVGSSRLVIVK